MVGHSSPIEIRTRGEGGGGGSGEGQPMVFAFVVSCKLLKHRPQAAVRDNVIEADKLLDARPFTSHVIIAVTNTATITSR